MKNILYTIGAVLLLASCTDDYKDWADPQIIDQPVTVSFGDGSISGVDVIKFADFTEGQQAVKVCNITAPSSSDGSFSPNYMITIGEKTFPLAADGTMSLNDLVSFVEGQFGKEPTQHDIDATVSAWLGNGQTFVKMATSGVFKVSVLPDGPVIENAYYYVGSANGWSGQEFKLVNGGGDAYADPVFSVIVPAVGGDHWFKILPESAFSLDNIWDSPSVVGVYTNGTSDLTGSLIVSKNGDDSEGSGANSWCLKESEFPAVAYKISINMMDFTYEITPINYSQYIYFIGATDGWNNDEKNRQRLESPANDGIYTGYLYIADPNGWGIAFKFQKEIGNWDSQLNFNSFTTTEGVFCNNGDQNLEVEEEGVYYCEMDLTSNSFKATKVNTMGIIGDFNGWGGDVEMTWNPNEFCYEATNAGINGNGWKFRINNDWAVNLGGNDSVEPSMVINDLVANGKNLGAVGTTIKLYPTRKTSDKIYCTVE